MICMFLFSILLIISCILNTSLSLSQSIPDIPLLTESKPYSTSLNQNQSKQFHINIEHYPSLSYIFITLHCYSGKAALSLTDTDTFTQSYINHYHSAGNTQYYQIEIINTNKSFYLTATITAYSNIYYSISYTTSINTAYHHFYINSNILQLNALSSIDELAHYHLTNPLYNNINNNITIDSSVFIDVTAINCEIKTTFNTNTSYSKHNQYVVDRNNNAIHKKEFDITIEVINFDSKGSNIPNEMCMFYIGNSITNTNSALLIDEGVIHLFTLTNEITSLSFKHPFFITRKNEEFFISITKLNEGKLNIKYYTYEIDRCSTTNEVVLTHKHNKKIMLKAFDMQNICEINTICWIHLEISYNTMDNENKYLKELLFQIEIVANAYQVPTYLPYGIIRNDAVYAFQYRYYYTTITNYNEGEIVLNFIHGSGTAIAKVVPYDHTDDNANWNGRIRLPVKEDINDNDNHLLEFDYFNSKFVFNETILQQHNISCEYGCEIYIGVFAEDITMMIGTPIYEFTIYIRNDDTIVNLPLNENVFGSLKRTEKYNEYDYYTFKVFSHSSKLLFDFSSSLCSLYINYGTTIPSKTNYNWYIDNTKRFFELNISDTILSTNKNNTSFYGNDFTIAISAKNLAGTYNAFYSFKTIDIINETDIPIIEIPSSKGEMCYITNNYDRCYFLISKREYDYVYKMYIFAKSEDHPDNAHVELYANIVNMDYYDGIKGATVNPMYEHVNTFPNEKKHMFSSKGNAIGNGVNGKYLCVDFYGFTSDAYVLVTLISNVKGRFMVMSTFHAPPLFGMLKPNADELVYLNMGFRTRYVIQGNDVYMVEVVHVLGEGDIKIINCETDVDDVNVQNGYYHLGETSKYKSVAFVLTSSYKKYLYIKALSYNNKHSSSSSNTNVNGDAPIHFLFYIRFYSHNSYENLNEVSYGRSMLIVYDNTQQQQLTNMLFPISLSIPIDNTISSNDNEGYLEINVELRYNNTFIIPSFFELTGVITNENFIINRKANIEALPEVGATTYKLFYDESLGIATFLFNKQDINNYFTISSTKIAYISLQPRITTNYTNISVNTLALFSNDVLTIPNDKYYYSLNTIKHGMQLKFKLNKLAYAHKVMHIELAKVGDVNITFFLLNEYTINNNNDVIRLNNSDISIIKDEFKYGKYYIDINIEYFIKDGNDIKELMLGLTSERNNLQNYLIKYTTTTTNNNVNDNDNVIELKESKFKLQSKSNTTTITFNSVYVSGNDIKNVIVVYTLKTYPIYSYANINEVYSIYLTQPPLKVYHYYNNTSLLNDILSFEITDLPKGEIYLSLIAYIQYKDNNGNIKEELLSYEPIQHYKGSFLPFNTSIPLHNTNTVILLITISIVLFCIFIYCYRMIRRMHLQHISEKNEYSFLIKHK